MYPVNGDAHADRDSMVVILTKFTDAYADFNLIPKVDEASELSAWTQEVFKFASQLEDHYGEDKSAAIMAAAWQEARQR